MSKEESSSPTTSMESVLLPAVIDANEQQDIATVNIPGASMQADQDELVHLQLHGAMAALLNTESILYMKMESQFYMWCKRRHCTEC